MRSGRQSFGCLAAVAAIWAFLFSTQETIDEERQESNRLIHLEETLDDAPVFPTYGKGRIAWGSVPKVKFDFKVFLCAFLFMIFPPVAIAMWCSRYLWLTAESAAARDALTAPSSISSSSLSSSVPYQVFDIDGKPALRNRKNKNKKKKKQGAKTTQESKENNSCRNNNNDDDTSTDKRWKPVYIKTWIGRTLSVLQDDKVIRHPYFTWSYLALFVPMFASLFVFALVQNTALSYISKDGHLLEGEELIAEEAEQDALENWDLMWFFLLYLMSCVLFAATCAVHTIMKDDQHFLSITHKRESFLRSIPVRAILVKQARQTGYSRMVKANAWDVWLDLDTGIKLGKDHRQAWRISLTFAFAIVRGVVALVFRLVTNDLDGAWPPNFKGTTPFFLAFVEFIFHTLQAITFFSFAVICIGEMFDDLLRWRVFAAADDVDSASKFKLRLATPLIVSLSYEQEEKDQKEYKNNNNDRHLPLTNNNSIRSRARSLSTSSNGGRKAPPRAENIRAWVAIRKLFSDYKGLYDFTRMEVVIVCMFLYLVTINSAMWGDIVPKVLDFFLPMLMGKKFTPTAPQPTEMASFFESGDAVLVFIDSIMVIGIMLEVILHGMEINSLRTRSSRCVNRARLERSMELTHCTHEHEKDELMIAIQQLTQVESYLKKCENRETIRFLGFFRMDSSLLKKLKTIAMTYGVLIVTAIREYLDEDDDDTIWPFSMLKGN